MMHAQRMPGACSRHARSMLTAMHWACSRDARLCASPRARARAQSSEFREQRVTTTEKSFFFGIATCLKKDDFA